MKKILILYGALTLFIASSLHSENIFPSGILAAQEAYEVESLLASYRDQIAGVKRRGNEIIFRIGNTEIYYCNGKMLSEAHIAEATQYDSIFYQYRKGPLTVSTRSLPYPVHRSSDLLDALFGSTEQTVRVQSRWVDFLGHRVFMHRICAEPLMRINRRIMERSSRVKELEEFLRDIKIMYSMKRRNVRGTNNMSYHSYGLAIDIIPESYNEKHVYWRWSSVFQENWEYIPAEQRWQPPQELIDAFEDNGFVWGGKWYYFDNVHFEYRPEILWLSERLYPTGD
jgi:hypothetical protein